MWSYLSIWFTFPQRFPIYAWNIWDQCRYDCLSPRRRPPKAAVACIQISSLVQNDPYTIVNIFSAHLGKTDDGPMMSHTNNVSTVSCISLWDKVILRVWKISDRGFMVIQHSIKVTNPSINCQPPLTVKQNLILKQSFGERERKKQCPLLFICSECGSYVINRPGVAGAVL